MTYFYIEPDKIRGDKILIDGQVFKHIVQVRRCCLGDEIFIIDGTSKEYHAKIMSINGKKCIAEVINVENRPCESSIFLTLYQALIKIPRFEIILEKAVELGVSRIVPVISKRTIFCSKDFKREKRKRWERIIISAACQSGRTEIPKLDEIIQFEDAIQDENEMLRLVFSPHLKESSLRDVISSEENCSSVGIFIGPEGGFTPDEIETARSKGAKVVSIGPRILRSETAAIASTAIVFYELIKKFSKS